MKILDLEERIQPSKPSGTTRPSSAPETTLKDDFSTTEGKIEAVLLDTKVLGRIIVCLDKNKLKQYRNDYKSIPVYYVEEMKELLKYSDNEENMQKLHMIKSKFGGWIVPEEKKKEIVKNPSIHVYLNGKNQGDEKNEPKR